MNVTDYILAYLTNLSIGQYLMLFGIFSLSYATLRYFYKTWQLIVIPKLEENMVETTIYISPYINVRMMVEPAKKRRKLMPGQFVINTDTKKTYFCTINEAEAYNKKLTDKIKPVNCSFCNATAIAYSKTDVLIFCYAHALDYSPDNIYAKL
jgi:hypothetical protein